ncbi:NADPH-dependent thioredoxin reductase 3-like protein, partial [Drosera capensis]
IGILICSRRARGGRSFTSGDVGSAGARRAVSGARIVSLVGGIVLVGLSDQLLHRFRRISSYEVSVHFNTEVVDVVDNTECQIAGILIRKTDSGKESILEARASSVVRYQASNNLLVEFHQVIDEFHQDIYFDEIDIEEDQEIAEASGIMGTPCVQFFKNKELLIFVLE